MIESKLREMSNLSRILTIVLCFAPVAFASAGPVATTAGNNLTAYNPSNANNNQWAMISNGRYDANNTSAKADFGNCNALILRCAQPKCGNGGCTDYSVASAIVKGCVQSNSSCKQYGSDLEEYMSAQLVASSNAKINEQNAAAQQAAAAAAAQQSQQQMQEMQYQMQQMQQQMAQQQAESQQQLQAALEQQAAQSAAALESMKTAATDSAKTTEAGISAYQQEAIERGISTDILERQKITGQIMTELENAEVSLKEVKTAMTSAFEYAKCDARGNNCEGPKRIKKWRELASEFLTPYDNTINKVYDALKLAQAVGVNLSDIYMMLNNSCNSWGQYMCPQMSGGHIEYTELNSVNKGVPQVCTGGFEIDSDCVKKCNYDHWCDAGDPSVDRSKCDKCLQNCNYKKTGKNCKSCTLLKMLTSGDDDAVYEGWVNAESVTDKGNTTVVACASGALDASALFARRTKNKNGAGLVDVDKLDAWLTQNEPRRASRDGSIKPYDYCDASGCEDILEKSMLSKIVPERSVALCVDKIDGNDPKSKREDPNCGYINPIYAICDAHRYNIGSTDIGTVMETEDEADKRCRKECNDTANYSLCKDKDASEKETLIANCKKNKLKVADTSTMKEVIALKTTVISQQMYKQYEYLSATLRRLKTQLEKATLTANLEAAGAKTENGSSSSSNSLAGSSSKNSQYENCSGKDIQEAIYCLRQNYSSLANNINNKKCNVAIQKQLIKDLKILDGKIPQPTTSVSYTKISAKCMDEKTVDCNDCIEEYSNGLNTLDDVRLDKEARRSGRYRDY